jgi:O-antigen/teichoic acid export membrane protein
MKGVHVNPSSVTVSGKSESILSDIKNLAGKSAIYGSGSILLRAIGFFLLPLYTRFLSPSDYGILTVTGIIVSILGILLPLTLHSSLNPIYFFTPNEKQRRADLGTVWLSIVLISGGLTLIIDQSGGYLFPIFFKNIPFSPYIRLSIWIAFLGTFSLVPLALFQIQERAKEYVLLTAATTILQIIFIIYFVVFQRQGAEGNLIGVLLGSLTMAMPCIWLALRNVRLSLQWNVLRSALSYSLPLVPYSLATWVLMLSDRAIIERFVSLEQLGLYSLGYMYGSIMNVVAYAINSAWVPFLFKTDAQEGSAASERLAQLGTYFTLLLCFVALGVGLFSKEVIELMTDPSFHPAARVAPWIVAGVLFSGLYYFPVNFLFLKKKTAMVPIITLVSGAVDVGLNLWLVPKYGIMAAAWSALISYGLMLILAWWLGMRAYHLPYEYTRIAKIAGVTITLWLIGSLLPFPNKIVGIFGKSCIVSAFPLTLYVLGFFTLTEKQRALIFASSVWIQISRVVERRQ